ncbi:MAG: hypothetical protein FWG10_14090 [Eubacteriaceae bacterium]|nr:hypothetical protein [Eubacteriaceae bacterium]
MDKNMKRAVIILLLAAMVSTMSGCMPGKARDKPAGLFTGMVQGWLAPFYLVFSFFDDSVKIYESYNTGFWYNLGFYAAVISPIGGLSLRRRKKKD